MIHFVPGNAARPIFRPALILHVVNDIGAWGRGFTASLDQEFPQAKGWYQRMTDTPFGGFLGHPAGEGVWIGHLLAQHGLPGRGNRAPIRYDALANALRTAAVARPVFDPVASVHMPRIGCGYAGGTWDKVEPLIEAAFGPEVNIYVYNLPSASRTA